DTVITFLDQDGWPYEQEVEGGLRTAFGGKNGRWECYIGVSESRQQITVLSICPLEAPPELHAAVAEFLHRANYGLLVGNFELDFNSGRVQCRTGIDVQGGTLTTALVKNLLYLNVLLMDRYLPGITAVIDDGAAPLNAIHQVEG
ncbi:MAG TPA: YbjN domain-containing protein, partial [Phototrophicaceae bacterium]|nr:YbjN domain-containing protein [Phototrophicaceae bacterium]